MRKRLFHAVTSHMRLRFNEWVSGIALFLWGLGVGCTPTLTSVTYFGYTASTIWLALACATIGLSRVILLFINGAWGLSPHFRAASAATSACTWTAMWTFMFMPGQFITSLAIVGALVALDIYSLWYAAEEARLADLRRREQRDERQ